MNVKDELVDLLNLDSTINYEIDVIVTMIESSPEKHRILSTLKCKNSNLREWVTTDLIKEHPGHDYKILEDKPVKYTKL